MLNRNRIKPLTNTTTSSTNAITTEETNGPYVYGSKRGGQFLQDLISGSNSLDVIIIGDSNTGSALSGGYGYSAGIGEALNNLNAPCYGTPLAPFIDRSPTGASRSYSYWRGTISTIAKDSNFKSGLQASTSTPTDAGAVQYSVWNTDSTLVSYGSSTVQGTLTNVTITSTTGGFQCDSAYLQVNQQVFISGVGSGGGGLGTPSGSIDGYTAPKVYYISETNGTTTFSLSEAYNGSNVTTVIGSTTGLSFASQADFNDWLYLPIVTVGNIKFSTGIDINDTHPLATNGVTNFLRVRYGEVPSGGSFYPNVYSMGAANNLSRLLIGTAVPMIKSGTQPSFQIYEGSFTANGKGHTANAFGYDASGSTFSKGPGALFCQSLYRKSKGWAVHSHAYQSGDNSTSISNILSNTSLTWLQYQLLEIRERQISAGGTGRVLLFSHSGINGADTSLTWTDAHSLVWKKYKSAWASLNYPAADLAIISIVGVQRNSEDTSGDGADLIEVRKGAQQMARANNDMTVVDVKSLMPYTAVTSGTGVSSYYQLLNNSPIVGTDMTSHLSGGYVSVHTGTATVTTATSITLTGSLAVAADGWWAGSRLYIGTVNGSSDAPAYQDAYITQYNGTTKVATVKQWTGGQPTNGVTSNITILRRHLSDGYTAVSQAILSSLIS
jgi:hypothetical protein